MREELDYVFIERFTEDEFNILLDILPNNRLTYLFKKFPKKFRNDIRGFRPGHIPKNILDSIYSKYIYEVKQYEMTIHIKIVIGEFLNNIEKRISKSFNNTQNLREEIREDYKKLEKLIDILFTSEIGENIFLYFKMVDYDLDVSQVKVIKERILYNKIKQHVLDDIQDEFENKLNKAAQKSKSKINDLKGEISHIENSKNELKEKLKSVEKKVKNLLNKNEELKVEIETKNKEIKNKSDIIETKKIEILELKDLVNNKYDRFLKYSTEKYENENEKLIDKNNELSKTSEKVDLELKEKKEIIENLNRTLNQMKLKENDLKRSIVDNLEKLSEYSGYSKSKEEIIICESKSFNNNVDDEIVSDLDFFIDDLISNLEISGIEREYSGNIAKSITATFIKKLGLVLVAGNNLEISNAISELISCRSADVITLPPNFIDLKKIIEVIKNTNSEVVFIDTPILQIHDEVVTTLVNKFQDEKILIFSCENMDMIEILNKRLLKYLNFIDLNNATTFKRNEELYHSKLDKKIFEVDIDFDVKKRIFNKLSKDNNISHINQVVKLNWSEMASIIDKLKGEGIESIINNNKFLFDDEVL